MKIVAYKITEDASNSLPNFKEEYRGRILTRHPQYGDWIMAATDRLPHKRLNHMFYRDSNIHIHVNSNMLEPIDLTEIKWIHPHLNKEVRADMYRKYPQTR